MDFAATTFGGVVKAVVLLHFHCRKKHNRPGRAIIRIRNNGSEQNIKNYFTSTEPNSSRDIGLFDVTEFEKER